MTSGGKILVVEDDRAWLRTYEKILTKAGYYVLMADHYETAIDLVKRHFFHAAMLDIRLVDDDEKNMHGMEILHKLSSNQEETGIFIITAYPDFESIKEAYSKHKILDFIDKQEFDSTRLIEKLEAGTEQSNKFLHKTKQNLSKFTQEETLGKIGKKTSLDIAHILESMVSTLIPIRKIQHNAINQYDGILLFESIYWSRFDGKAYNIKIGQRKQILELAQKMKQEGKDVFVELKQGLSGIRYEDPTVNFD